MRIKIAAAIAVVAALVVGSLELDMRLSHGRPVHLVETGGMEVWYRP